MSTRVQPSGTKLSFEPVHGFSSPLTMSGPAASPAHLRYFREVIMRMVHRYLVSMDVGCAFVLLGFRHGGEMGDGVFGECGSARSIAVGAVHLTRCLRW
jgi:hypothetical protein